jgi:hypothetical protein
MTGYGSTLESRPRGPSQVNIQEIPVARIVLDERNTRIAHVEVG